MDGIAGVTAIETTAATVTVSTVLAETEPETAVIVVVPVATLVASPWLPEELLMVATAVLEEVQVAVVVRFCVLPLVKVPVAVNCWAVPSAIEGLLGVSAIETKAAGVTVNTVEPLIEPEVAVMVDEP